MSRITQTLAAFGLALALGLAGCSPRDPLDLPVKAATAQDYNFWLNDDYGRLGPLAQKDYDEAFRELNLAAMTAGAGLSTEEQKARVLSQIDGRTVREVIILGFTAEISRVQVLRADAAKLLKDNEHLLTTPSKPEEIRTLRMTIWQIQEQIAIHDRDIAAHQARIKELSAPAAH